MISVGFIYIYTMCYPCHIWLKNQINLPKISVSRVPYLTLTELIYIIEQTTANATSLTANGSGSQWLNGARIYCPNVMAIVALLVVKNGQNEVLNVLRQCCGSSLVDHYYRLSIKKLSDQNLCKSCELINQQFSSLVNFDHMPWTVGSIIKTDIHNRKNAVISPKASKI